MQELPETNNPKHQEASDSAREQHSELEQSPVTRDSHDVEDDGLVSRSRHLQFRYQGPLPPPSVVSDYQELYPQAAEILFKDFDLETKHRIRQESRGQWMSFVVIMIFAALVALALFLRSTAVWAVGLAAIAVAILVSGLIYQPRRGKSTVEDL